MRARNLIVAALLASGCNRPDVVFITVDTLRVDHVSAYNADSPAATPFIDSIAADGVLYEQAYSPISVTGPSFCTLHTGLEPGTHGVTMNLFRGGDALPEEVETMAERLTDHGFRTAAYVSGFTLRKRLKLNQGFDVYSPPADRRRAGVKTTDKMLKWLEETHSFDRLFVWWHTYDPHGPLDVWGEPPATATWPYDADDEAHIPVYQRLHGITSPGFYTGRYARAVEHTDTQVGRIVSWLKKTDRYDSALIVVTADHGETFTERELWFDHGTTAHEEQLHVPLIIKYPKARDAGTHMAGLVVLADIFPTVLDALGYDVPTGIDGRSLVEPGFEGHDLIMGESSHCKDEAVLRCSPAGPQGKSVAARSPDWTLMRTPTTDGVTEALYDRNTDLPERVPRQTTGAPAAMRQAVDAMAADRANRDYSGYEAPAANQEAIDEQAALEALGYRDR